MAIKAATPRDTDTIIFGAGIPNYYTWWKSFEPNFDPSSEAPDDWRYTVTAEHPKDEQATVTKEIGHTDLMRAVRVVARKDSGHRETLRKECNNLIFNVDECDMDASDADVVLQLAVYGEVIFG
ncbi:hypothetical protein SAMN05421776_1172 [Nocardia farcinica]|uniref:Uncharacterized protein n=1 Tax=Nocardia farcinica TaxID=37329 RepID=A0A0H5NWK7_NOCFR|nr:hypothetical protein [Nocardia farcinica]AXK86579.1 hypothetical protein DXT66_13925 [Nocardia farcinica]PFW99010.1 hypothetical protein CJ469_05609 [Nocardia farcinica]PFX06048.1 hypothetical protein CJ468_04907 [Nocardia farcinica]CRY79862.1 Uncharacterised protein [Nocardia farcinica]SIT33564.1 hypothetical protein SAMN05421776_1172 [Nocardia farcinica]